MKNRVTANNLFYGIIILSIMRFLFCYFTNSELSLLHNNEENEKNTIYNLFQEKSNAEHLNKYQIGSDYFIREILKANTLAPTDFKKRKDYAWESIGPTNIAGRMLSLAINPKDTAVIWAGSAGGGLWKSKSGGLGPSPWEYVNTGFPVQSISSLAINAKDPNIIFAGTGEVYNYTGTDGGQIIRTLRGSLGIGVLRTLDGGQTWNQSLSWKKTEMHGVWKILIDPNNSDIIYAGTTHGIYKSIDNGEHWEIILQNKMVSDMMINPEVPEIIYAAIAGIGSNEYAIYKTLNAGKNWDKVLDYPSQKYGGRIMLAMDKSNPNQVFALLSDTFNIIGFKKSINGFDKFFTPSTPDITSYQGWYSKCLIVKENDSKKIIAGGVELYIDSSGTGNKFVNVNRLKLKIHADFHDVITNPKNPEVVYFATDGGIYRSDNFLKSIYPINEGLITAQFYKASLSNNNNNFVIAGLQDNGSAVYNGNTKWASTHLGDGISNIISSKNDSTWFCMAQNMYVDKTLDGGKNWIHLFPEIKNACFASKIKMSKSNPNVLFAGGDKLYSSSDEGVHWRNYILDPNSGAIFSLDISPNNSNRIVFATAPKDNIGSSIYISDNAGKSLYNISPNGRNISISDIVFDPQNDDTIYAAVASYGSPHLFKYNNSNWEDISQELPDVPVYCIHVDPRNSNYMYVGTDIGVFYTDDGGKRWNSFNNHRFDLACVYDIKFSQIDNKLLLFTHGLGAFKVDAVPIITKNTNYTKTNVEYYIHCNALILNNEPIEKLSIYALSGQLLSAVRNANKISLENLSHGVYLIEAICQHKRIVFRCYF